MQQLKFEFAIHAGGHHGVEPGPCRSCTLVGPWQGADCGVCMKLRRQNAKRRYWTATGRDRNGAPK